MGNTESTEIEELKVPTLSKESVGVLIGILQNFNLNVGSDDFESSSRIWATVKSELKTIESHYADHPESQNK
jgi:hypothetical protein